MLRFGRVKFNLAFLGPDHLFNLRRDFLLATKYGLESLGHDVFFSGGMLDARRFNLVVGAYFLPTPNQQKIAESGFPLAHLNTEVIAQDTLNLKPDKTDFLGAYLPMIRKGAFVWDVILDNLEEHRRYGTNAHFMRWGHDPKLEEIEHRQEKDLDFYFFGTLSARRQQVIGTLDKHRFAWLADHICPYFVRNDRIARAKVNLNIVQEDKYTHVNSFRICYLANNRGAILSELESDPAGYLDHATVVHKPSELAGALASLLENERWKAEGERAYQKFREIPMKRCMEELLDASFGRDQPSQAGTGT